MYFHKVTLSVPASRDSPHASRDSPFASLTSATPETRPLPPPPQPT